MKKLRFVYLLQVGERNFFTPHTHTIWEEPLSLALYKSERGNLVLQGRAKRKGAKFGEESFVKANWLCIGCPKLVGSKMEGNSNRGHFFCTSL